jgi:hypothetical protein
VIDKIQQLAIAALFVAIIGGVAAYLLGAVLGAVTTAVGFPTIIGGFLAVVLLLVVAAQTDIDSYNIFEIVMLLVMVSVVGTIIVTILPAVAGWILTASGPLTFNNLAWSLVYVGLGLLGKEMVL